MAKVAKSATEVDKLLKFVKDNGIEIVDLRFTDLPGQWQHFSMLSSELTTNSFDEGVGFAGSSIRGFQAIQESDMVLIPDPKQYFVDPFTSHKTVDIICDVKDPVTGEPYRRDPRYIAQKAEAYLLSTGALDWGPISRVAERLVPRVLRAPGQPGAGGLDPARVGAPSESEAA